MKIRMTIMKKADSNRGNRSKRTGQRKRFRLDRTRPKRRKTKTWISTTTRKSQSKRLLERRRQVLQNLQQVSKTSSRLPSLDDVLRDGATNRFSTQRYWNVSFVCSLVKTILERKFIG